MLIETQRARKNSTLIFSPHRSAMRDEDRRHLVDDSVRLRRTPVAESQNGTTTTRSVKSLDGDSTFSTIHYGDIFMRNIFSGRNLPELGASDDSV